MEGAGAHLNVVRLQDDAALLRPEGVQTQDQVLEGKRALRHGAASVGLVHRGIEHRMVPGQGERCQGANGPHFSHVAEAYQPSGSLGAGVCKFTNAADRVSVRRRSATAACPVG